MISFVKGKFNFLASFCIVALFFLIVAIITAQYMYRKIKKYSNAKILSHSQDNLLLLFMCALTAVLGLYLYVDFPGGPQGQPQPDKDTYAVTPNDFYGLYDIHVDKVIGLGHLNEEGWWDFQRLALFQNDIAICPECNDEYFATVVMQSVPASGQFRVSGDDNQTATFENNKGRITLNGKIRDVNKTLNELEFQPTCILDKKNAMELNVTFYQKRELQQVPQSTLESAHNKRYRVNLNLDSGVSRLYRGKLYEEAVNRKEGQNYFKPVSSVNDVKLQFTFPYSKGCAPIAVTADANGVFETNLTLLNTSIPYTIRIQATKPSFDPISVDYFVGGYPTAVKVELGSFIFVKSDTASTLLQP